MAFSKYFILDEKYMSSTLSVFLYPVGLNDNEYDSYFILKLPICGYSRDVDY